MDLGTALHSSAPKPISFLFLLNYFILKYILNVVLISSVQQNESVIHIHIATLRFFSYIGYYRILSSVSCAIQ